MYVNNTLVYLCKSYTILTENMKYYGDNLKIVNLIALQLRQKLQVNT